MSGEKLLPGSYMMVVFSLCPHSGTLWGLFIRALIPLMRALSSWSNHPLKLHLQSHWGLVFNIQILWEHKHSVYSIYTNRRWKTHVYYLCTWHICPHIQCFKYSSAGANMKYIKIQPTVLRTNNVVITVVGIGELKMKILSLKILQHK